MKSKILKTFGLIAALVSCVGLTVFAEPSPSASTVVTEGTAKDAWIEIAEVPADIQEVTAGIKTESGLKAVLGDQFNANLVVADVVEVIARSKNGGQVSFPIDITFKVKGVTASTKGWILHYSQARGGWEKIDTTIGEGTMTGTFYDLSPVAFVVDKTTVASGATTSLKTSASSVSTVALLGLVAIVAAFGLKKKAVVK